MTGAANPGWFPYAFPLLFVGTWLIVAGMIGFLSGWFNLQQWYPDDGGEQPLLELKGKSGSMGVGVGLNGILKLRAYPSGLGVRISRIFAPFQKPLRIPWSEIEAHPTSSFLEPMVKLDLGKPANGRLKISARNWSKLVEAVLAAAPEKRSQMPAAIPVSAGLIARAMIVQWAVMAIVMSGFFVLASWTAGPRAGFPLAFTIGVTAVVLGIGQLIRYARES